MKTGLSGYVTAMTLLVVLAMPLSAQQPHYKLIDIGTFGGSSSYLSGEGNGTSLVLNDGGVLTGWADTSMPDPFPNFCFDNDCLVAHAFQWRNGVMTNLGALKHGVSSASAWISSNGLIAGVSENGEVDPLISGFPQMRAVLWRNGHITNLGTLPEGGHESVANVVNNRGQVAGAALNDIPDLNSMFGLGYQTRAFLWQNGVMQDLGTLGTGTDAQAVFMNEKGQVVGWSYIDSTSLTKACNFKLVTDSFIWDKQHGMVDLGSFGGSCTIALAVNSRGQVVGESNGVGDQSSPAFIWENGSFKPLGGSLGGDFTVANAINDQGEVAGSAYLSNDVVDGPFHAALWKHIGDLTDLGTVGSDPCSYAASINARTQVVGASISDCALTNASFRAFLWTDGTMFDLNALITPGSSLTLQSAETINDRGEIAGSGVDGDGNEHAFLLIPCDEQHPGLQGCDSSMVDTSTVPNVAQRSRAQGSTTSPQSRPKLSGGTIPLLRFRQHPGARNRVPRGQTPTSSFSSVPEPSMSVEKCPGGPIANDKNADQLLDSAVLWNGLTGYCLEDNGKLTGSCAVSIPLGPGCLVRPTCSKGVIAKNPGVFECCGRINCVKEKVDFSTKCSL